MTVPLLDLQTQHASIRAELDEAIRGVIAHGQFVQGPDVAAFEEAYAAYCGVDYCIGTSNGTSAIELVLRAAGIGAGDEVVTSALTFIATVEPILLIGATPILVDVDSETGLMDVAATEAALTRQTAAVVPVHLYGQTVDLDAFRVLADRHKLLLIEDAAQAHGAAWRGQRAGSVGDAATFSFFPGKNLGALGDAGCVTTRDGALAGRVRKLRDHGRMDKYRHDEVGTNARLDTLQAAVLAVKLRHLEEWNEARRRQAARYDDDFISVRGVEPIRVVDDALPVYHQYVVRVADRDRARSALNNKGIAAAVHYPIPLHRQPALAKRIVGDFPAADALADSVLSLPIFPELTDEQRGAVVTELSGFVNAAETTQAAVPR